MSIFEYNEELHRKSLLEEGREAGRKEGMEAGRKEGMEVGRKRGHEEGRREERTKIIYHMLSKNQSPEAISDMTGESVDNVYHYQQDYIQMLQEKGSYTVEKKEKPV